MKFFYGPMDCGKSTLALQMDYNHARQGRRGLVFTRYDRSMTPQVTTRLGLRRDAIGREANIVGPESAAARKALLAAVERLAVGAGWLSGLADAELAAAALWRGTLLSNGLIRGAKTTFALRAPNGARAATLRVAAELLGVEVQTTRTSQGLRIQLDDDAAETLLDRLAQPSGVARVLVTEGR